MLFLLGRGKSVAQSIGGYKIGDRINSFSLRNTLDSQKISLNTYQNSSVVVILFTSHNCAFSKHYETRLREMIAAYRGKSVQFLMINSNTPETNQQEQYSQMSAAAREKKYNAPYLQDSIQYVANQFGATRNPEAYVLSSSNGHLYLRYHGAIDDNPQVATDVSTHYVKDAIDGLLSGAGVKVSEHKAVGCMIKK